jgi:hypothetical protein
MYTIPLPNAPSGTQGIGLPRWHWHTCYLPNLHLHAHVKCFLGFYACRILMMSCGSALRTAAMLSCVGAGCYVFAPVGMPSSSYVLKNLLCMPQGACTSILSRHKSVVCWVAHFSFSCVRSQSCLGFMLLQYTQLPGWLRHLSVLLMSARVFAGILRSLSNLRWYVTLVVVTATCNC